MLIALPRDEANAAVTHMSMLVVAICLAALVLLLGITYVLLHAVTTPIGVLCSLMEKIAGGDLTTHLPASSRSDEIGALQNSCRDMMTSLQTMVKTTKEAADHVSESSEELTASSSQSADAAQSAAEAVVVIAEESARQSTIVQDATEKVMGVNDEMKTIRSAVDKAQQAVASTGEATEEGAEKLRGAIRGVEGLADGSAKTSAAVEKLYEGSKNIAEINELITSIAGQTKLLALNAAIEAGLNVDDFAGRLSFFWNAHNNVLEEVAKYRASRRIWAKIMRDRFGAKKDKSMKLRFHTQTAGSMLTAQQPDNNIVRVALQTAAAVMGGTQSLHTNSRDEALALPTEESVSIALHTQHIVAHESGLADVIDPLAGSYYVEAMTNRIEKEAMEYIKKIDEMGGAVAAIEKGYIQKEIQDSAYAWQMDVESGARVIVGVNKYQKENEEPPKDLLKVDASVGEKQKKQLAEVKAKRDNAAVKSALEALKNACEDEKENLMPHILTAVKTYATLGEICGVMRSVFGEYEAHTSL